MYEPENTIKHQEGLADCLPVNMGSHSLSGNYFHPSLIGFSCHHFLVQLCFSRQSSSPLGPQLARHTPHHKTTIDQTSLLTTRATIGQTTTHTIRVTTDKTNTTTSRATIVQKNAVTTRAVIGRRIPLPTGSPSTKRTTSLQVSSLTRRSHSQTLSPLARKHAHHQSYHGADKHNPSANI